jgi:hypothetical protein
MPSVLITTVTFSHIYDPTGWVIYPEASVM